MLTKTDYILFRECPKNVWYKQHKPEIFLESELSEFEKAIIETGNEVELAARTLFPEGILIEGRDAKAQELTQKYITTNQSVIFQAAFLKDNFFAALDILKYNSNGTYSLYEVKATSEVDKKTHYHDLAFQVNLLSKCGIKISHAYVIHLNSEYVRQGEINTHTLFKIEDVTERVQSIQEEVMGEMEVALTYLSPQTEPVGHCVCIYKGRSNHCATFKYSNPTVPAYGVHDISRIGASKARLQELIDVGIFKIEEVPEEVIKKLSDPQKNQIFTYVHNKSLIDLYAIKEELSALTFPLYFLDYETYPSAIPRFNGFSPYQQIPFQYSLFVVDKPGGELSHFEFLYSELQDPTMPFVLSLQKHIGESGSIIVWNKKFECKINEEIAARNPDYQLFIEAVNKRVYDLMEVFGKQWYVHKDFKGRISIKNVLPVLVPELSYKSLQIQEGGTASQKWNEITSTDITKAAKEEIINNLKEYCKLDTFAMVKIWEHLHNLVS